ncbi:hypothetical protein VZ95_05475 [Elstera litoralis]|uniref:SnoaL-like domain-containing protein n=1 Tax=Elstera litoralis TaxID=552518 RepID=A0A0F3IUY8_9PROT|nr:hypothetical protein VZ95_05475 [Elstera litoralis]
MTLNNLLTSYFSAEIPGQISEIFSIDAIVVDEAHAYVGPAAIAAWWQAAQQKYRPIVTPLSATDADGKTRVAAEVAGDFPNSPITLHFTFAVQNDRITALEIA